MRFSQTFNFEDHQSVLSNSNQGFSSTGEEESFAEGGRVLGRARALVDCTPSPYDKDGLAFKKGDVIDILAKSSSGYWVGRLRNQIGHFKFINVEEIQNGDRKTSKRRLSSFEQKSNLAKTLEDLLEHLGLEVVSPSIVPSENFAELIRTITRMVLKANDRRTSSPLPR
ncbi:SAM and SH3 domain-containing protein 1 [Trichonephila clavipes]|nr:SAM and SH3 domain-containing protein 1 [Trichonephila clavipes]